MELYFNIKEILQLKLQSENIETTRGIAEIVVLIRSAN